MAELKTTPNEQEVEAFLAAVEDAVKQADCRAVLQLMEAITEAKPKMWGKTIVGFGSYRYRYKSGREGEWFLCGFSPRKQALTIYIMSGFETFEELMSKLGKYKTGKSCLYIKRLENIDMDVLRSLITASVKHLRESEAQL